MVTISNQGAQHIQSIFNKSRKDKFVLVLSLPAILREQNVALLSARAKELIQLESLQYSIWGSPVPDVVVPAHIMKIWGQPYKVTSQSRDSYHPITVHFNVDNLFNNYWLLWKWLEVLNAPLDSGMPEHFADYQIGSNKKPVILDSIREKAALAQKNLQKGSLNKDQETKAISTQPINMINNFLDYQTIITIYALNEYNERTTAFHYYNCFITRLAEIQYNYRDPEEIESAFDFEFNQMDIELLEPTRSQA